MSPLVEVISPVDPLQQALDSLVAKGLVKVTGYRDGKPIYVAIKHIPALH